MSGDKKPMDKEVDQHKPQVLRAGDVIPPFNKPFSGAESKNGYADKPASNPAAVIKAENKRVDIPSFDLSKQIMSEHRQISASKRKKADPKSTSRNSHSQPELIKSADEESEQQRFAPSRPNKLIAQIVARDIARFCKNS